MTDSFDGTPLAGTAATVAVACGPDRYKTPAPYSPRVAYPEYPLDRTGFAGDRGSTGHGAPTDTSGSTDTGASPDTRGSADAGAWRAEPVEDVYGAVRASLAGLGLDSGAYGSARWNPLGGIIRPGDLVVIKPNLVREFRETHSGHADCLITHGAIIRAVVDYCYVALGGRGRIVIADAPHSDANFDAVARITQLRSIQDHYRETVGFDVEVYDLRPEQAKKVDGVIVGHSCLPGDPAGYTKVDLGERSMFNEINPLCRLLYGSEYDTRELVSHHSNGRHEYLISRTVLKADCVISLPKLKTHKKTGLTVNMKNLVGINGNKNWLPHHREGTPSQGGDQFMDDGVGNKFERSAVAGFKRVFPYLGPLRPVVAGHVKAIGKRLFGDTNVNKIRSGNWYGNDTTWRMVIDLNRILLYADADGRLHDRPVRRWFSVVDGIIGGEGNGPLDPVARPAGVIVAGFNPVAVDLVCARIMGFDYEKLPVLQRSLEPHALRLTRFDYDDVQVMSNRGTFDGPICEMAGLRPGFKPHFGWKGHIEIQEPRKPVGAPA